MTFSNTVIDMKDLMRYHYPKCRNDSLAHMAMDLHIPFPQDNPEARCRLIRRIYEKTDRAAGRGLHGYPDDMKELADRRPPGWEILLFSRAYAAGYEQLACWRTAKRARASYENLTHFIYSFQEMTAFVSSKSDDLIAILQDAEHVLDVEIPAVLSGAAVLLLVVASALSAPAGSSV